MKEKKLVPKRRFKEFQNTDAWEQRMLKDVSTNIRGSFPQPYTNPDFYDEENGKPFVQVADIGFDLKLNSSTKAHISKLAEPKSRFVEAGKVVVALQGSIETSIGRTAITQYDAYFDRTILIFEDYKVPIDKLYFAQVIKKLFELEKERAWGATISTITKEYLNDFIIGIPSIKEQQKIGQFFKHLDEMITLEQRKIDKTKALKSAYLAEMFPAEGERVPKSRFAGFNEDWEQHLLGNISDSYSGGTPTAGNTLYYGGEIPFIRSGEVSAEYTELFITEEGINNSSAKLVDKGDILYALYGATSGQVGISRINGAINQAILAIKPKYGDDSYLITEWLRKQKGSIIETYLQGGQGNLSGNIVKQLIIDLPRSKKEQQKIGVFFKKIDDTITNQQQKLDKLKATKQAYLHEMFV